MKRKPHCSKLAFFLALALFLASLPLSASAFWPFPDPEPPVQEDFCVSTTLGATYVFSQEDFSPTLELAECYQFCDLPDPSVGVLQIGATLVEEGGTVAKEALPGLTWYPLDKSVTEISFTVIPITGELTGEPAAVTIYHLKEENTPPEAKEINLTTYRKSEAAGVLLAEDADGHEITFRLLSQPEQGTVILDDSAAGTFTYTPGKHAGRFSFSYLAVDQYGGRSHPATVHITVEKKAADVVYSDLSGTGLDYAASKLAQEGIYVGQELDGRYCFQPNTVLTRSEFVVMAVRAAGLAPLEGVENTGFADDNQIPIWAKPYVAAALQAGVLSGRINEDGSHVFCPTDSITPGEAAALLNRLLPLSEATVSVFAPAMATNWAGQAVANLCSAGIMTQEQALGSSVTRGDAALMLCSAMEQIRE